MPINVSSAAAVATAAPTRTPTPTAATSATDSPARTHTLILTHIVKATAADAIDADASWSASRKGSPDGMMRESLPGKTGGDGCGGASSTAVAVAAAVEHAEDDSSGDSGRGGGEDDGRVGAETSPPPSPVTVWCAQPPPQTFSGGFPSRSLTLPVDDKGSNCDCGSGVGADGAIATATPTATPADSATTASTPTFTPPTASAWAAATPPCLTRRYTLTGVLSTAGLSPVLTATDRASGATVAVKILAKNTPYASTPNGRSALAREVAVLRSLSPHPAIVGYVDVAEDATAVYLITEALLGGDLLAAVRRRPFGVRAALRVARQLLEGLAACHAVGVAHRDVKLANVVVSKAGGRVKLVDFGLCHWRRVPLAAALPRRPAPARAVESWMGGDGHDGSGGDFDTVQRRAPPFPPGTLASSSGTTRAAAAVRIPVGTPGYVCPEIVDGRPYIPEEADVYGVGVILYALVSRGMPPAGLFGQDLRPSDQVGGRRRYVHLWKGAAAAPPSASTSTSPGSPTCPPPPPPPPPPSPPPPPPPPATSPVRPSLPPVSLSGRWATAHPQVVALLRALLAPRGSDRPTAAAAAIWVNALLSDPSSGGSGGCGDGSLRHPNPHRRHPRRRSMPVEG